MKRFLSKIRKPIRNHSTALENLESRALYSATPLGSIVGTVATAGSSYNLSTLGSSDWAHWGSGGSAGSFVDDSAGGKQISNVRKVGSGNYGAWSDPTRDVSWTGGAQVATDLADDGYLWANQGVGAGYSFTAPADTTTRTLYVYLGGYSSGSTLTAHLSDGAASNYAVTLSNSGHYSDVVAITYNAASAGQTLTITYVKSQNINGASGSTDLIAAWLQKGGAGTVATTQPTTVSTPVTTAPVTTTPPTTTPVGTPVTTAPVTTAPVITAPVTTAPVTTTPVTTAPSTGNHSAGTLLDGTALPGPTNTGATNTSILKASGSITVTTPGALIQNLSITGTLEIDAPNVTVENCVINANQAQNCIFANRNCNNLIVEDTTVTGSGARGECILSNAQNAEFLRINMYNTGSEGFELSGSSVIKGCYLHQIGWNAAATNPSIAGFGGNAHVEDVFIENGASFSITGNYFDTPQSVTVNGVNYTTDEILFIDPYSTGDVVGPVSVNNNDLDGGGYMFDLFGQGKVSINNNILGPDDEYGYIYSNYIGSPWSWAGNVNQNGASIAIPTGLPVAGTSY